MHHMINFAIMTATTNANHDVAGHKKAPKP